MRNGILREGEGFDIMVDGMGRTFRDLQATARRAS
jgi:hypothetical protein